MKAGKYIVTALVVALAAFGAGTASHTIEAFNSESLHIGATTAAPNSDGDGDGASAPGELWVNGEGRVEVEPDLALLDIGVDSSGLTVAEANMKVATAIDAVFRVIKARDIEDSDIQTSFFNIRPKYERREVKTDKGYHSTEVLVGYEVSNHVRVKIRDLDAVGNIIDEVIAAGGDDIRIKGINFTLEDMASMTTELRELAMKDALTKAEHLAELSDVRLGRARYIEEWGVSTPFSGYYNESRYSYSIAAAGAPTQPATAISSGMLEMTMSVRVKFAIE